MTLWSNKIQYAYGTVVHSLSASLQVNNPCVAVTNAFYIWKYDVHTQKNIVDRKKGADDMLDRI